MAYKIKRNLAVKLRKEGKSYSQIKKIVKVSKSTLSYWLSKYPLTKKQIYKLQAVSPIRIEKFRETMRLKKEKRLNSYYEKQKANMLPLSKRELFIAGISLYWGEGSKNVLGAFSVCNTDPNVLRFSLLWLTKALGISKLKVRVALHLYKDMKKVDEIKYWSKILKIPKKQFYNPYIKKSNKNEVFHKGYGHGTCALYVYNNVLREKILMAIKVLGSYSEENLS